MKKQILLKDIVELKFVKKEKVPCGVKISTKTGTSRLFQAGPLSDKDWVAFKDELEKRNVAICDEFVSSIVFYEYEFADDLKEIFSRFKRK